MVKDEINVPIALSAFRDNIYIYISIYISIYIYVLGPDHKLIKRIKTVCSWTVLSIFALI